MQEFRITSGDLINSVQLILSKRLKFHLQDSSLNRIQPRIQADTDIVIFERSLSMHTVRSYERGPFVIVSKHCAAVSIASQWLGGKERRRRDIAERTGTLPFDSPTKTLRTIFQDQKPILISNSSYRLIVGRQAKQINSHNNTRTKTSFSNNPLYRTL